MCYVVLQSLSVAWLFCVEVCGTVVVVVVVVERSVSGGPLLVLVLLLLILVLELLVQALILLGPCWSC